jgi:hypothetical protein
MKPKRSRKYIFENEAPLMRLNVFQKSSRNFAS